MRQKKELGLIVILILIILLPFINKAYHIDDTLVLYPARQILKSPLRPLNFDVNWYGLPRSMWEEGNPPLLFYYPPLITYFLGEKEIWLHFSFLIFPLIAGIAMYFLGKRFTKNSLFSTLLLIATPAYLVMSTNIMLDVPLLAFYLAAVATHIYGVDRDDIKLMVFSGILIGITSLIKYSGLTLMPLLLAYSFLRKKNISKTLLIFLIPLTLFGLWCIHNIVFYRSIHLLVASRWLRLQGSLILQKTLGTLSYIGGATIFPLLFILFLCRKKKDTFLYLLLIGLSILISLKVLLNFKYTPSQIILYVFFASLGLLFCVRSTIRNFWRDSDETFLLLWFWGIFFMNILAEFAAARFVLILVPPLIFLLIRIAEKKALTQKVSLAGIVLTLMLGLLVSYGDYRYANCYRDFALKKVVSFKEEGRKVWFRGHWGFQYYMEREGFEYLAIDRMPARGDLIIMPSIVDHEPLSKEIDKGIRLIDTITYQTSFPIRTMHQRNKAGFYSHGYGFLSYAFSKDYLEEFKIYKYEGQT